MNIFPQEISPANNLIRQNQVCTQNQNSNFTVKIFFYCCPTGRPENAAYQHELVCLAEGLKLLNYPFFSNINYWRTSIEADEFLLNHEPSITPDDCSIVVLHCNWFDHNSYFPENLFHPHRNYLTVYFDSADGIKTNCSAPEFRSFDFIFKAHFNSKHNYPSNVYPWAFGFSNRIVKETEVIPSFEQRTKHLTINFRVNHNVREAARKKLFPSLQKILHLDESIDAFDIPPENTYDYLQWSQTGRRHYPIYYKRLKQSVACACFGGYFVSPLPTSPAALETPMGRLVNKIWKALNLQPQLILQWDSWRLWESLASGCVTFHVDFEKYGLCLPLMPENWRHYIGIDLDNIQEAVERIANSPDILERISTEGRLWALEHYSPVPTTLRFLETVSQHLSTPA